MGKCGRKCDVYSRVVGYHRPIRNWNKGKKEEFYDRLEYSMDSVEFPKEKEENNKVGGYEKSTTISQP